MLQPHTGSLLVDYYESYIRDQDIDAFRRNVSARYSEGTLSRLLQARDIQSRRASVLALGLFGGYGCNAALARTLRDTDPTVRTLADNALWAIWFRADSSENNDALEKIHTLISRGKLGEAIHQADVLIARAPTFAEAHNQRAIAHYFQGRFAESVEDCRNVIIHNPYHTGALSGMGQCQLRLGRRDGRAQDLPPGPSKSSPTARGSARWSPSSRPANAELDPSGGRSGAVIGRLSAVGQRNPRTRTHAGHRGSLTGDQAES